MTVTKIEEAGIFTLVNKGEEDKTITKSFCCDLLSFAMGRAPEGAAWVTVMGNINTIAVAELADVACIILAEGASLDEPAIEKAKETGVWVFKTEEPIFDAALKVHELDK